MKNKNMLMAIFLLQLLGSCPSNSLPIWLHFFIVLLAIVLFFDKEKGGN